MSRLNCSMTQQRYTVKSQSVYERHSQRSSIYSENLPYKWLCQGMLFVFSFKWWKGKKIHSRYENSPWTSCCLQYHRETKQKDANAFIYWEKVITIVKVVWFVPWKTGDATMCKTVSTFLLTHIFLPFKVLRFCFRTVRNHQYQIDDVFISNALLILKAAAVLPWGEYQRGMSLMLDFRKDLYTLPKYFPNISP